MYALTRYLCVFPCSCSCISLLKSSNYYYYYYYYYYHHHHFMHGIYNYIHETNRVSRVCSVAAVLYLQFALHVMLFRPWNRFLYFYISTSRSMCAVHSTAALCSSLISCFPGTLLRYGLSNFELVPVAPVITGITVASIFHMGWISVTRSLYFKIF
jgi:hypothetical protein